MPLRVARIGHQSAALLLTVLPSGSTPGQTLESELKALRKEIDALRRSEAEKQRKLEELERRIEQLQPAAQATPSTCRGAIAHGRCCRVGVGPRHRSTRGAAGTGGASRPLVTPGGRQPPIAALGLHRTIGPPVVPRRRGTQTGFPPGCRGDTRGVESLAWRKSTRPWKGGGFIGPTDSHEPHAAAETAAAQGRQTRLVAQASRQRGRGGG